VSGTLRKVLVSFATGQAQSSYDFWCCDIWIRQTRWHVANPGLNDTTLSADGRTAGLYFTSATPMKPIVMMFWSMVKIHGYDGRWPIYICVDWLAMKAPY
jgi:hypothetical protein